MTELRRKRRRRWRLQFSLRTLLLVVLLVSLACSWFATKLERLRRRTEAIQAIRESGGEVLVDSESNPWRRMQELGVLPWLREAFGDGLYYALYLNVCEVRLIGPDFGDKEVIHLSWLSKLEDLSLSGTRITDAGLVHLETLTNLRYLHLTDTQVTDAGLEHLKGLSRLRGLYLEGTKVTPEGVKKLQEALPDCEILY